MGITVNPYEHTSDPDALPYGAENEEDAARIRTDMNGTLDTSGVGAGRFEDLRNVTDTFDAADARIADVLEASDVEPTDSRYVEGADPEATNADLVERLRSPEPDPALNPTQGEPGEGLDPATEERQRLEAETAEREAAEAAEVEKQRQEALDADALTDAQRQDQGIKAVGTEDGVKSTEEVLEGTVPEIEDYLLEHPEQAGEIRDAEEEKSDSPRKGVIEAAEAVALYDPTEHKVGEVKEYFATADDAEISRVQAAEASGQNRPGIVNYTKA